MHPESNPVPGEIRCMRISASQNRQETILHGHILSGTGILLDGTFDIMAGLVFRYCSMERTQWLLISSIVCLERDIDIKMSKDRQARHSFSVLLHITTYTRSYCVGGSSLVFAGGFRFLGQATGQRSQARQPFRPPCNGTIIHLQEGHARAARFIDESGNRRLFN